MIKYSKKFKLKKDNSNYYFFSNTYIYIEQRRNFTRFLISSHRLQIERGQYQGALRQDRFCLRCTSGEKHFLISCSTCPEIRTEMFSRINNICQNFHVLNPEQTLYWLLNNENEEILASICNLIKTKHNIIK